MPPYLYTHFYFIDLIHSSFGFNYFLYLLIRLSTVNCVIINKYIFLLSHHHSYRDVTGLQKFDSGGHCGEVL